MYKRTSPLLRSTLPVEIVKEDEAKENKPPGESVFEKMDRKRKRLWNEALLRERMSFTSRDIVKASFANLIGATRHVSMLQKGIQKMHYDFDVVRIVRTLKNVSTAMQSFLSEPNKLYLRYGANNIIQTSSDEERFMREWNKEDKYLDLSPDEEDDKQSLRAMVVDKKLPRDYNAPMIGEQIIQKSFAVKTSNLKTSLAEKAI